MAILAIIRPESSVDFAEGKRGKKIACISHREIRLIVWGSEQGLLI